MPFSHHIYYCTDVYSQTPILLVSAVCCRVQTRTSACTGSRQQRLSLFPLLAEIPANHNPSRSRAHALAPSPVSSRLVSRRTARSGDTSRRATGVSGSTGSIPADAVTPVASTTTVSSSTSSTLVTSERCVRNAGLVCRPPPFFAGLTVASWRPFEAVGFGGRGCPMTSIYNTTA